MKKRSLIIMVGIITIFTGSLVGCGGGISRNDVKETADLDEIERLPEDQKESELDKTLAEHRKFRKENKSEKNGSSSMMSMSTMSIPSYPKNVPSFEDENLEDMYQVAIDYLIEEKGFTKDENDYIKEDFAQCIDPRIMELYDNEDKGLLSGYNNENIFVIEYEIEGRYEFLFLVRKNKNEEWHVKYEGTSYKG
ncbi:MAG: hypothetical protein ACRCTZ_16000 [Sarcina sp.]